MKKLLLSALLASSMVVSAQTTRQEVMEQPGRAGGVYYAYPNSESHNTPAPKGYKPFYISHYGRHGSRYLISDDDYVNVIKQFKKANDNHALSELGENVLQRLDSVWEEAQGRGGELSPLGARQHHDIATRMYKAFPEVFAGSPEITAKSTVIMRCAHSMFSFVSALKEQNPSLQIPMESGNRAMYYLNYHTKESSRMNSQEGAWFQEYHKFKAEKTHPERMMASLFSDSTYVRRYVDPVELMWGIYWVTIDMQNMESKVSFLDLWKGDELFDLWQVFNFEFYARNSSYPQAEGAHVDNAKNLMKNIVETADEYIKDGKNGATLRFGHDGNIVPLTALFQFPGCVAYESNPYELYKSYADFKVSPMGANLQVVFFKNKAGDVIVKFMLNEQEVKIPAETDNFPFYKWSDARAALQKILDTPSKDYIK
jgi:hypothetical protein